MGNLAGVKTQRYLESLAPTAERDLYLAMSWQQSGETAKAEQLYRRLPDFAESWNNLGVILKGEGQNTEAQQAFQKALELDPQLNEAALNLGRKSGDLWTSQYGSYFPGRLMLAPPRTAHSDRAFFGGSLLQASARAIVHPLEILRRALQVTWSSGELALEVEMMCLVLGICAVSFAVLLVSVIPHRDVTLPPAKGEWIWTTLFPGLGSEWGYLAWLVLAAWSYLLIQLGLFLALGTPYVFTAVSMPNLVGSYGLSASPMQYRLGGLNPGWMAMYAAPVALFAINALLVFRGRRPGRAQ
jgi:tetratricopeptide (TPR) repeat protein